MADDCGRKEDIVFENGFHWSAFREVVGGRRVILRKIQRILIEALLGRHLVVVVDGTELEDKVAHVVGSQLDLDGHALSHDVPPSYDAISVFPFGFMFSWYISIVSVSTDSTLAVVFTILGPIQIILLTLARNMEIVGHLMSLYWQKISISPIIDVNKTLMLYSSTNLFDK